MGTFRDCPSAGQPCTVLRVQRGKVMGCLRGVGFGSGVWVGFWSLDRRTEQGDWNWTGKNFLDMHINLGGREEGSEKAKQRIVLAPRGQLK